jgi:hypothetical protein
MIEKLLNDAADYLETYGWIQGAAGSNGGPACVIGALAFCGPDEFQCFGDATERLRSYLGCYIAAWNDTPGRTKEEVVRALRLAAIRI